MNTIQENRVLNIIRYSLPILTIIVSAIFISFIIFNNINEFKEESNEIRKQFIVSQKNLIKNEVDEIYRQIQIEYMVTEDALKKTLINRVNEAYDIAMNIYNENKHSKSKDEIIKMIKDALREIKFLNKRGYYYINDMKATSILYPPDSSFEGKNYYNIQDSTGRYITRDAIEVVTKKKKGFTTFLWHKPNDNVNYYKKVAYNRMFEPYNIYIGTGEYMDNFEADVKREFLKRVQDLKYGVNGYVFIVDYDGTYLSHIKKSYVGLNRINLVDKNGIYITKDIIETAKKGNDYISYIGTIMPQTGKPALKTTYVKGFSPWNWAIASGFYHDEIHEIIKNKRELLDSKNREYIINILVVAFAISIILFIISIYISKILGNYFINYRKKIYEEIRKNKDKDFLMAQQAKMAAMGEMLENIAHQWRQPLSIITTSASGIQLNKELGILSDEMQNESIEVILKNAKHLSQTIDDFRDFFSSNKPKEFFDLFLLSEKSEKLYSAKIKQNDICFETKVEHIEVFGYENMLIQVLINLYSNSIDAFNSKNIENRKMSLEIFKENNNAIILYKDNAGGIKEEILDRVFEPYFTTKHQYNGTGIGLYMSQEIVVKHMDGNIKVKNIDFDDQKGVEFKITLPLYESI